jgi:signal transduction histidine kinase
MYADEPAFLLVPSPLAEDRILLANFTSGLYRGIPLILLVSGFGGYILSRRALKPVDVLIAEARTVTAKDLSRRLTVSSADDQLQQLAVEWNNLLARIETAMIRVTQFTADASHELRNPIAYIRATAEYSLGNPVADDESREAFRTIVEETRMTSELLENLLTLARPDADLSPTDVNEIDVPATITELSLYFAPMLRKKNQRLEIVESNCPLPPLLMNILHLRRVLTVVLDNAVKYTPEEGSVSISCELNNGLHMRIADSGIGIAPQHLNRIFDRFFRVDQARSEMSDGVGLGLSIAKLLMELYGGSILVESQPGLGTSVTLVFPQNLLLRNRFI